MGVLYGSLEFTHYVVLALIAGTVIKGREMWRLLRGKD